MLKQYRLTMPQGLLQQVYDERGQRYDLPPFVINPALKYGVNNKPKKESVPFKPQDIRVTFRSAKFKDTSLDINTNDMIEDIKQKLMKELNVFKKIKLFYAGKELVDSLSVGNYPIKDQYIIQVFFME